jgi:hypothetical protein
MKKFYEVFRKHGITHDKKKFILQQKRSCIPCESMFGYVMHSKSEWETCSIADYEADEQGSVLFQGIFTGKRLLSKQLRRSMSWL